MKFQSSPAERSRMNNGKKVYSLSLVTGATKNHKLQQNTYCTMSRQLGMLSPKGLQDVVATELHLSEHHLGS